MANLSRVVDWENWSVRLDVAYAQSPIVDNMFSDDFNTRLSAERAFYNYLRGDHESLNDLADKAVSNLDNRPGVYNSLSIFDRIPADAIPENVREKVLRLAGGGAVVAADIWAVITYVWPAHETPTAECVQQGVKIGGNVSGSTVKNTISGGTAMAGPCLEATKK